MVPVFQCPDCHQVHSLPLSAAYVILVRCPECELALKLDEMRDVSDAGALPTAA